MKLLTIFPSHVWGGAEAYALTIATAARQSGWEVHAGFPEVSGTVGLIQAFVSAGVEYHRLQVSAVSGSKLDAIKSNFFYLRETIVLLKRLQPDVVHITIPGIDHSLIGMVGCAVVGIPAIAVFQLVSAQRTFHPYRRKIYTWAKSKHQQWVAVSQNTKLQISEIFQLPPDTIQVIPNGAKSWHNCKSGNTSKGELRQQLLQELRLPDTSRILLTVGRLSPQKGYHDLLEIIPDLLQTFPALTFVWAGEGEQREVLEHRIQALNLSDRIFLLGQRSDVFNLLQAADFFIFPTYFEGLPFALIEAMAAGLPIVASDSTSIPEVIDHKVQGYLFPVGDRAALLEAIRWMLTHPVETQQMANAAQIRSEDFTQEKMIKSTINTLKSISFNGKTSI